MPGSQAGRWCDWHNLRYTCGVARWSTTRRVISWLGRWACGGLAVLCVACCVASVWVQFIIDSGGIRNVTISRGTVESHAYGQGYMRPKLDDYPLLVSGLSVSVRCFRSAWTAKEWSAGVFRWPMLETRSDDWNREYVHARMPLWMPIILLGGVCGFAWARHARRNPAGVCGRCDYDLGGLKMNDPCPECGHPRPNT